MYKWILCCRYLKTRYLAMACIISVMLGVATLIVVNSVMSGFSTKLRDRLHGLLSDVVIESQSLEGFTAPREKMDRILQHPFLKTQVEAMAPSMEVFAMLQYRYPNGELFTRPVRLMGINPDDREKIGPFKEYLKIQKDEKKASFEPSQEAKERIQHNEDRLRRQAQQQQLAAHNQNLLQWEMQINALKNLGTPEKEWPEKPSPLPTFPEPPAAAPQGAIIGNLLVSFRRTVNGKVEENKLLDPGDSLVLTTVSGPKMTPVYSSFVLVDYFNSEMSEYDGQFVFVPLDYLQKLRSMEDQVTAIQIKLKDYDNSKAVVAALREMFENDRIRVETWEDKQGPLLAAISIEKGILNVLLFLIIAVAGFGILAIFSMIVAEKTRDIGILKALGASNAGVMKIFLGYGLLLGVVGAGLGSILGVSLTVNINGVEQFLTYVTGQEVFKRDIYYFKDIPYNIEWEMLAMVNVGSVVIAVLFSVLPAFRAALLHPVRALRYE